MDKSQKNPWQRVKILHKKCSPVLSMMKPIRVIRVIRGDKKSAPKLHVSMHSLNSNLLTRITRRRADILP